ncbi:methyltransferase domain-containing protein [Sulfurospirillum deleyianum]|uniref:Methyltransferase type 12 n=1 Tax=Sulfurospirillum deleyianum (strain ATCC 51133 / DSM 6946 / 5175) TaxID=525898 RepID=D1B5B9_SULD5|nr:methyltransferase domain-containing protein [Sulfurospirillum deleyianum]ACZ13289.1 Methyltransferase type 12 [Sulfurospirillum deleyianum DSM 6946]
MMAQHIREFSKNAHRYDAHTALQQEIARYLVSKVVSHPQRILDLGCGSGAVFKTITWEYEHFIGVDCALAMCQLHPKNEKVEVVCDRFEKEQLLQETYDLIISSSALQWACDIEGLVQRIAFTCKEGAFAIFTDKTFETLYQMSGLPIFLPSAEHLQRVFDKHFTCHQEVKHFHLSFEDNRSLFRYIKNSGVSGGEKRLSVAQTKKLIETYPHPSLECEVLFVWGKSHYN